MFPPTTLKSLLERIKAGDDMALTELWHQTYDRLRMLTSQIMRSSFPRVREQHDTTSVLHEVLLRLRQGLMQNPPLDEPAYETFVRRYIWWVLQDYVRQRARYERYFQPLPTEEPASDSEEALRSRRDVLLLELFTRIALLPETARIIIEGVFYYQQKQSDLARSLNLPEKQVSRIKFEALEILARDLPELSDLLPKPD